MDYRLAVVVVAVIALAGCSMGGDTGTPTPSLETVEYPDQFSANGTGDSTALLNAHEDSLLQTSNYSVRWQFIERQNGSEAYNTTITGAVSPDTNESVFHIDQRGPDGEIAGYHQETYFGDGQQHSYSLTEDRRLGTRPTNFSAMVVVYADSLRAQFDTVELEAASVERLNDTTLITYNVTGLTANGSERFESASGTLRVTESGRLVRVDLSATTAGGTQTFRYVISEVDGTAVQRPDWVESAS